MSECCQKELLFSEFPLWSDGPLLELRTVCLWGQDNGVIMLLSALHSECDHTCPKIIEYRERKKYYCLG